MSIEYQFVPYKSVGEYYFGMKRFEIKSKLGEPLSSYKHGYSVEDRFLDDYGFFHILCSNKSEGYVEDVIIHDSHCYAEELQYLNENDI